MALGPPCLWAPDGARAPLSTGDRAFCSAPSTLGTVAPSPHRAMGLTPRYLDGHVGEAAGKSP